MSAPATAGSPGTMKFYHPNKGYGFIRPVGGGPDVMVRSDVVDAARIQELGKDMLVSFVAGPDPRGGKSPLCTSIALRQEDGGDAGRTKPKEAKEPDPAGEVLYLKFFNTERGFGFFKGGGEGGKDLFVHISAVERSGLSQLVEGQGYRVTTKPDETGKGPKADRITLA